MSKGITNTLIKINIANKIRCTSISKVYLINQHHSPIRHEIENNRVVKSAKKIPCDYFFKAIS